MYHTIRICIRIRIRILLQACIYHIWLKGKSAQASGPKDWLVRQPPFEHCLDYLSREGVPQVQHILCPSSSSAVALPWAGTGLGVRTRLSFLCFIFTLSLGNFDIYLPNCAHHPAWLDSQDQSLWDHDLLLQLSSLQLCRLSKLDLEGLSQTLFQLWRGRPSNEGKAIEVGHDNTWTEKSIEKVQREATEALAGSLASLDAGALYRRCAGYWR